MPKDLHNDICFLVDSPHLRKKEIHCYLKMNASDRLGSLSRLRYNSNKNPEPLTLKQNLSKSEPTKYFRIRSIELHHH